MAGWLHCPHRRPIGVDRDWPVFGNGCELADHIKTASPLYDRSEQFDDAAGIFPKPFS